MDNVKHMAEEKSISYTPGGIVQFANPVRMFKGKLTVQKKIAISFNEEKTALIYMRTEFRLSLIQWVLAQGKYYMSKNIRII